MFCVRSHQHRSQYTHIPAFPLLLLVLFWCPRALYVHVELKIAWGLYGTGVMKATAVVAATTAAAATSEAAAALVEDESGRICIRAKANVKRTRFYRQTETLLHHSVPVSISLSLTRSVCVCTYKFIEWLFIRAVWYQSLTRLVVLLPTQIRFDLKKKDEEMRRFNIKVIECKTV